MVLFYGVKAIIIKTKRIPVDERLNGFQEVADGLTEEEVISKARRCFNCGSCTECGNCYIFCPENSIKSDLDGYGYIAGLGVRDTSVKAFEGISEKTRGSDRPDDIDMWIGVNYV